MVVIGIIALLISIALPAFQGARDQVRATTTHATIRVLETGLESFRADTQLGGNYPPSIHLDASSNYVMSPHTNLPINVYGANLLVWALAGADLLGSPGFRDLNSTDPVGGNYQGLAPWADDTGKGSLYYIDGASDPRPGQPHYPRIGPFVDVSKTKFAKQTSPGVFEIPADRNKTPISSLCILDAWDQPILYYRANPSRSALVSEYGHNTATGIYALDDNVLFTGSVGQSQAGMDFGAGTTHPIATLGTWLPATPTVPPTPVGSFAHHLYNPNIKAVHRPHNADSYILLSPGKDGRFGTADDVANFEVNK